MSFRPSTASRSRRAVLETPRINRRPQRDYSPIDRDLPSLLDDSDDEKAPRSSTEAKNRESSDEIEDSVVGRMTSIVLDGKRDFTADVAERVMRGSLEPSRLSTLAQSLFEDAKGVSVVEAAAITAETGYVPNAVLSNDGQNTSTPRGHHSVTRPAIHKQLSEIAVVTCMYNTRPVIFCIWKDDSGKPAVHVQAAFANSILTGNRESLTIDEEEKLFSGMESPRGTRLVVPKFTGVMTRVPEETRPSIMVKFSDVVERAKKAGRSIPLHTMEVIGYVAQNCTSVDVQERFTVYSFSAGGTPLWSYDDAITVIEKTIVK